jgi:DNA-directed RNA polymerase subunit K/omega
MSVSYTTNVWVARADLRIRLFFMLAFTSTYPYNRNMKTQTKVDQWGREILRVFCCNDGSAMNGGAKFTVYRMAGRRTVYSSYHKPGAVSPGDVRHKSLRAAIQSIPAGFVEKKEMEG